MALEQGDYIDDLDETWPLGTDPVSQGDDHVRLIKKVLLQTFPNLDGPVTATPDELNNPGNVAGTIQMFGGQTAPEGYVICNGAALSRVDFADLYTAIGVVWGNGNGSTTFNVPNMTDRTVAGVHQDNPLGSTGGKNTHGAAEVLAHTHTTNSTGAHTHSVQYRNGEGQVGNGKTVIDRVDTSVNWPTTSNGAHSHTVNSTGSATVDNRQATLYVNYIIKT